MKIQSEGWRLSIRTKLVSCDWQPSPFTLYISCCTALFIQYVCVCVLFYVWTFCCWSGVGPTRPIHTASFLFNWDNLELWFQNVFSTVRSVLAVFTVPSMFCVCLLQNFILYLSLIFFPTAVAFHCVFSPGLKLKCSVCFGSYIVCCSAGDFVWHFIKYINFSHFVLSLPFWLCFPFLWSSKCSCVNCYCLLFGLS